VINLPLGNRRITERSCVRKWEAWREEVKVCEKPCLPVSTQEDCTESWLVVRSKASCNFDVFPPSMIKEIVGFLDEAFA